MRAGQLQILPDEKLAKLQKRQFRTIVKLPARRGAIVDRNGKELAVSVPTYSLFGDPQIIKDRKYASKKLGRILKMDVGYFKRKLKNKKKRFVWLKRGLSKEYRDQINKLNIRGLGFVEESKRIYPNGQLFAQALGFTGRDAKGLEGLELGYDSLLRGENKSVAIERDARGRPLLVDGRVFSEMPAGADVELTIDSELQFVLEKALHETTITFDADSALGIVMDPKTNEILAMGYAPTFDANKALKNSPKLWRNKSVTDIFEPGSVIKPLVVAGAIRDNIIKPNTKFDGEGGRMRVGRRVIREADSHHVFGKITVSEIIARSSNVGTAKIALEMGPDAVRETLEDFGFGEKTGVGLPGESRGMLGKLPWGKHLNATTSIGHGAIAATPLQIVNAYSAIANGGVLRKPLLVRRIHNPESGDEEDFEAEKIRRVLSRKEAKTMRLMLTHVTGENGTGQNARVPGFPVAGKTGTAQKVSSEGGYSKGEYVSSFVGMIPSHDPQYVILVSVDNPKEKYYGSEVAAPLFSRIAGYAIRRSGMAPILVSEKNVMKPEDNKQANALKRIRDMAKNMRAKERNQTPDLMGLHLREVINRVRGTDVELQIRGKGRVTEMWPEPGMDLPENKKIKLKFETY